MSERLPLPVTKRRNASGAVRVPKLYPGSTIVCLASGPSLTPDDVDRCRGYHAIAINDSYRLAPWAVALMASDASWWEHHQGVPEFRGRKYCLKEAPSGEWGVETLVMTGRDGIETAPTGLRSGSNSGAAAINLAVHFGATRVLLLGYDMQPARGRTHWFGDHPVPLRRNSPYGAFMEKFALMVEPLAELGVTVVNCSRETALECFPRQPLEEALCG